MARYTSTKTGTTHVLDPTKHQSHRTRRSAPPHLSLLHYHRLCTIIQYHQYQRQFQHMHCADTTSGSTRTLHQAAPTGKHSTTPPFDYPLISFKLIKHIPKSARPACCRRLSEHLNVVTANTDDKSACTALLTFGTNYLLPSKRGGKRHNMTTVIRRG